jgi:hypothetical protein
MAGVQHGSSRLELCVEWGGSRSSSDTLFLCLSRFDESLQDLVAVAVTDNFPPGAAASISPAFAIDWRLEDDVRYHVQLCDTIDGNKRVLSDCQFNMSEAVAARRLRRPLLRQLSAVRPTSAAPTATLMLSLKSLSSARPRVLRLHASCEQLRATDAIMDIQFMGGRFVGEGLSRIDSDCHWKMRACVTETAALPALPNDDDVRVATITSLYYCNIVNRCRFQSPSPAPRLCEHSKWFPS